MSDDTNDLDARAENWRRWARALRRDGYADKDWSLKVAGILEGAADDRDGLRERVAEVEAERDRLRDGIREHRDTKLEGVYMASERRAYEDGARDADDEDHRLWSLLDTPQAPRRRVPINHEEGTYVWCEQANDVVLQMGAYCHIPRTRGYFRNCEGPHYWLEITATNADDAPHSQAPRDEQES